MAMVLDPETQSPKSLQSKKRKKDFRAPGPPPPYAIGERESFLFSFE